MISSGGLDACPPPPPPPPLSGSTHAFGIMRLVRISHVIAQVDIIPIYVLTESDIFQIA